MKAFSIASAVALLAAFAQAAPAPVPAEVIARTETAKITFEGAAGVNYVLYFNVDGSTQYIGKDQLHVISVSHITSNDPHAKCTFHGIDGSVTVTYGAQEKDVGPPQTQISGTCVPL